MKGDAKMQAELADLTNRLAPEKQKELLTRMATDEVLQHRTRDLLSKATGTQKAAMTNMLTGLTRLQLLSEMKESLRQRPQDDDRAEAHRQAPQETAEEELSWTGPPLIGLGLARSEGCQVSMVQALTTSNSAAPEEKDGVQIGHAWPRWLLATPAT